MSTIVKDGHVIAVERHPQPWPDKPLYEAKAPDGYKWSGDTWSIHGDDLKDLRARADETDLEAADDEDL